MSKNILTHKFGKLTAIKEAGKSSNGVMRYYCECDCGGNATVRKGRLLSGETTSCGCKQIINMIGQESGMLTVLKKSGVDKWGQVLWLCKCECGGVTTLTGSNIRKKLMDSCGCLTFDKHSKVHTKHGLYGTSIYNTWSSMKARCNDMSDKRYGGRGISYCEEWENFEMFYNDMGDIPQDCTEIDRINNEKGYSKENCRWTTKNVNTQNTRRSRYWTVLGVEYSSMFDAICATGLSRWRIQDRCHREINGFSTRLKYEK